LAVQPAGKINAFRNSSDFVYLSVSVAEENCPITRGFNSVIKNMLDVQRRKDKDKLRTSQYSTFKMCKDFYDILTNNISQTVKDFHVLQKEKQPNFVLIIRYPKLTRFMA
jgi:hypothetical protein